MKASKIYILLISLCISATAVAQEYRYELGFLGGGSMYMGDANQNSFFKGWHPSAGIVFRNNLNFHWALKTDLMWGQVSGDTKNTDNQFPFEAEVSFARNFFRLGGQMEFNFFPYSDKYVYQNTKKVTPYILCGLGLTMSPGAESTFFSVNMPLGFGVKYKLRNKLNIGVEYSVNRLFGDGFDSVNKNMFSLDNPYGVKNGLFKNKDWYNTLQIFITWEFGLRDSRCM